MTLITEEMKREASVDIEVAPDILFAAEAALAARGVDDAERVVPALLAAAWYCHKNIYGTGVDTAFANLLRGWADSIDAMTHPN